ncbi:MAG: hypothetical protein KDN22_13510 [Verrucomicrobiae bacterium]|nr:hypothetical protein [Verrucomicrobiae bacterium]
MDRSYSKKGLLLIGAESQGSTTEDIQKVVDDNRIKFPITKGASGPISISGIPHMLVFDTTGKLVFSGHPGNSDAEKAIRKSLKAVAASEGDGVASSGKSALDVFKREELIAERSWTNSDGRALVASLTSLSGTTGTFRRPDGRTFEYDITKLSEDDQKMIKDAQESREK